jgi:hypothetical protein
MYCIVMYMCMLASGDAGHTTACVEHVCWQAHTFVALRKLKNIVSICQMSVKSALSLDRCVLCRCHCALHVCRSLVMCNAFVLCCAFVCMHATCVAVRLITVLYSTVCLFTRIRARDIGHVVVGVRVSHCCGCHRMFQYSLL